MEPSWEKFGGHSTHHGLFCLALLGPTWLICLHQGKWVFGFFLPTVLAFRAKKITQFIHHHSYRSINLAPMASHCALAAVGGVFSRHVLLSEKMLEEYSKNYLSMEQKSRALVVPNAFLFTSETSQIPARQGPIKIGHISVMTKEKGVDYILKLIDLVMPSSDFQFVFAGPIEQSELFDMVQSSIKKYPGGVHWLGPVSGNEKEQFYDAIDILLLPSRLIDEADPLVILEAYSAGVAVMASDVGCISERIISKSYLLKMDCVADAESIKRKADELKKERQKSASRFQAHARWLFSSSKKQGEDLLRSILDGGS